MSVGRGGDPCTPRAVGAAMTASSVRAPCEPASAKSFTAELTVPQLGASFDGLAAAVLGRCSLE
ncbi:hypothetical protein OV079_27105 [Nannocystis pusilla]|uniref:Uncharacterized protein n=1 Tax=Nannocystis pusilla TaxID=889268 RepID=A0A9X3ERU0_9BACT|nr:hypothetical protein [Nannocystis pusilla]MCY1009167.1 hypothetical protein [Nannocystis pusilla]